VCIAVDDNGPGVPLELHSRIFEPYFTTKEEGKGTGLGLATVYGIVNQSHGEISVRSSKTGGASFLIKLPRAAEDPTLSPPTDSTEGPAIDAGRVATILIVDDEAPLRELLVRICESAGYRVLSAENGAAALAIAEQNLDTIDLVISDVVMPGLKGPDLVRTLLERRPELAVMLMSGYAAESVRDVEGLECEVLSKPFAPKEMLEKVRAVLAASAPSSSTAEHG